MLIPLVKLDDAPMRVAGLMSGAGTNIRRIIEWQLKLEKEEGRSPFEVVVIFSNSAESKAVEIGRDFDIPVVVRDMKAWYAKRGAPRSDMNLRRIFDSETVKALSPYRVQVAVYGGYMAVATDVLINAFLGVNVHPADLSITDEKGKRRFTGDHAVLDAILAGEKTIASTTHIIEPEVDGGRILMISDPLEVEIPPGGDLNNPQSARQIADMNQERLKREGDWVIFPKTIEYLARGRFAQDERGVLYFDGKAIPNGLRYSPGI